MVEFCVAAWVLVGVVGLLYRLHLRQDITVGQMPFLVVLGALMGPVLVIIDWLIAHEETIAIHKKGAE